MSEQYWTAKDIPNLANIDLAIGVMERVIAEDAPWDMWNFGWTETSWSAAIRFKCPACFAGWLRRSNVIHNFNEDDMAAFLGIPIELAEALIFPYYEFWKVRGREITPQMVIEKLQAIKAFGLLVQESLA